MKIKKSQTPRLLKGPSSSLHSFSPPNRSNPPHLPKPTTIKGGSIWHLESCRILMEPNDQPQNRGFNREAAAAAAAAFPLRLTVVGGRGLVAKDYFRGSSDPYVIVIVGDQTMKTNVVKQNLNPEWNQVMTFTVRDPSKPIRFEVFDRDHLSKDDAMGNAELDIKPFVETVGAHRKNGDGGEAQRGRRVAWGGGGVVQDAILGLKLGHVDCGELLVQLSTP